MIISALSEGRTLFNDALNTFLLYCFLVGFFTYFYIFVSCAGNISDKNSSSCLHMWTDLKYKGIVCFYLLSCLYVLNVQAGIPEHTP